MHNYEAFTFGEPMPVLDMADILDFRECYLFDDYFEMPISAVALAKTLNANPHHRSALTMKRNLLVSSYKGHPLLSRQNFSKWVFDYLIFGNAYLEAVKNRKGHIIELRTSPAKYTRVRSDLGYVFVPTWNRRDRHYFDDDSVFHLLDPDINQELYGLPEYLAGLSSAWLNESATLFRRKYYANGSHAGFILYMTDAAQNNEDIDNLRNALQSAKGPGNFRNVFMYAPDGQKDGLQVIPIADVSAKDEFFNIKNTTRDDVLAAHRVYPQLIGVIPSNTGGFGSIESAAKVFARNEIQPLQERIKELNDWMGEEIIVFNDYELTPTDN